MFRSQVCIDEHLVRELIFRVVMDVLRHVFIKDGKRSRIGRVSGTARDLLILYPSKFVVLLPEIRFQNFRCRQESQDRRVALTQPTAAFLWSFVFLRSSLRKKRCPAT